MLLPENLTNAFKDIQTGLNENPTLLKTVITPQNQYAMFDQFLSRQTTPATVNEIHAMIDDLPMHSTDEIIDQIVMHLKQLRETHQNGQANKNSRQLFTMLMNQSNHHHSELYYAIDLNQVAHGQINAVQPLTVTDILHLSTPTA